MTRTKQPRADQDLREPTSSKLAILGKPYFWVVAILGLWCIPLIKSLTAELPHPLSGVGSQPIAGDLIDETGRSLTLDDLKGYILVIGGISFLDQEQALEDFTEIRKLRKRLRGMGSAVVYIILVDGASPAELSAFVDSQTARKPVNVFAIDLDHEMFTRLKNEAPSPRADYLLVDTHGRLRGLCSGEASSLDLFVASVGQLANWRASDPDLAEPEPHDGDTSKPEAEASTDGSAADEG